MKVVSLGPSQKSFMNSLIRESEYYADINEQFRNVPVDWRIASFYEELPMVGIGMVSLSKSLWSITHI